VQALVELPEAHKQKTTSKHFDTLLAGLHKDIYIACEWCRDWRKSTR